MGLVKTIERGLERIVIWASGISLVTGGFAAIVKLGRPIGVEVNWAGAVLIGFGLACVLSLVLSVALIAWRKFHPIPKFPDAALVSVEAGPPTDTEEMNRKHLGALREATNVHADRLADQKRTLDALRQEIGVVSASVSDAKGWIDDIRQVVGPIAALESARATTPVLRRLLDQATSIVMPQPAERDPLAVRVKGSGFGPFDFPFAEIELAMGRVIAEVRETGLDVEPILNFVAQSEASAGADPDNSDMTTDPHLDWHSAKTRLRWHVLDAKRLELIKGLNALLNINEREVVAAQFRLNEIRKKRGGNPG